MKTNTATVQTIYDAFGRGDIPFILDNVAEQFTWTDPCNPAVVPQGGKHIGREGFLHFFQQLGGHADTTHWEVNRYVAEGDTVVGFGKHGITVKATGKSILYDWAMCFTFDGDKPVAGRSFYDTAAVQEVYH